MGSSSRTITTRQVGFVMVLSALTMPYLVTVSGGHGTTGAFVRGYGFAAIAWGIRLYSDGPFFGVADVAIAIIGSPLLLYALLVQRYCSGKLTWKVPVLLGAIVNAVYAFFFSPEIAVYYQYGILVYIGPLPITFVLGLILMALVGTPTRASPFQEGSGAPSWWKSREPFSNSVS